MVWSPQIYQELAAKPVKTVGSAEDRRPATPVKTKRRRGIS